MVTVTTAAKTYGTFVRTEIGSGVSDFSTTSVAFVDATNFKESVVSGGYAGYEGRFKNGSSTGTNRLYINLAVDIFSITGGSGSYSTTESLYISDIIVNSDASAQDVQVQIASGNAAWTSFCYRDDSGAADVQIAVFWEGPNAIVVNNATDFTEEITYKINVTKIKGQIFGFNTWPASISITVAVNVLGNQFVHSYTTFQERSSGMDNVVTTGIKFRGSVATWAFMYDWEGTNIRVT